VVGKRLRLLRTERKLTQEELGKVLGVGKTTISQYESEVRKPDADMLKRIAQFFDVSVDYLLGLTEEKRPVKLETLAAHRTDDPLKELPEEARRSLEEFKEYILRKYGKK
jgi:transcriptional regulator with XRE-family HTH domain